MNLLVKKTSSILLLVFIIGSSFITKKEVDTNAKLKAVFMYNFTKYIEWPKAYQTGYFVFGIVGDTPLYDELTKMAQTKKIGNQPILVKKFNSAAELDKCHLLYVTKGKSSELSNVIKKVKSGSTLIVTEQEGLVDKGAGINFVVRDNKQKFEMNTKSIETQKLKVSSNLEALAVAVK